MTLRRTLIAVSLVLSVGACASNDGGISADPTPSEPAQESQASDLPDGVAAVIEMDEGSNFIVAEGDSIWVTETGAGTLARIDPDTNEVVDRIDLGDEPDFLSSGEGKLWVTSTASGVVWRVDPESGDVAKVRLPAGGFGLNLAFGSLWVASRDADKVFEIDPIDMKVLGSIDASRPEDVVGAFGKLWIASSPKEVVMADPNSGETETIAVGGGVHSLFAEANAVWVGSGDAGDTVTKLDKSGDIVGSVEIDPFSFPDRMAIADGLVWVGLYQNDHLIGIDPTKMSVERELPAGAGAAVIASGFGDLWIANFDESTVWRVEL